MDKRSCGGVSAVVERITLTPLPVCRLRVAYHAFPGAATGTHRLRYDVCITGGPSARGGAPSRPCSRRTVVAHRPTRRGRVALTGWAGDGRYRVHCSEMYWISEWMVVAAAPRLWHGCPRGAFGLELLHRRGGRAARDEARRWLLLACSTYAVACRWPSLCAPSRQEASPRPLLRSALCG